MEVWKDIPGYEGSYQVSNLGMVKSLDGTTANGRKRNGKVLAQIPTTNGYLKVHLYKDKKTRTVDVQRLVALAFIPNPQNLPQVNHKDEDKSNNRVDNLEWCSRSYNMNYGTRNGRMTKTRIRRLLPLIPTEYLAEELERRYKQ